jgi:hypothetical protein
VLQSFRWNCDVLGQLSGRARITNTNGSAKTGTFTISLFKAGSEVGSLEGAASGTDSGKTVTVDLISMDPCLKGTYKYDFQTDISY